MGAWAAFMSSYLNILFCVDEKFAPHMAVTMASTISNTEAPLRFLVVGKLCEDTKQKIIKTSSIRQDVKIDFLDPIERLFNENFPIPSYLSFDAYVRIWVATFYGEETKKVLYLDADIIVLGDVAELFDTNLEDAVLGAVPIPWFDRNHLPGYKREYGYFNSGVLLLNMARWRERNVQQRVISYIVEHSKILHDPDQDALNACLFNEKHDLPLEWNAMNAYFRGQAIGPLSISDVDRVAQKAKAVHFSGTNSKPWLYMSYHPKKELYYEYRLLTPWAYFKPLDKSFGNILKKNIALIMPIFLKNFLKAMARAVVAKIKAFS